jgi:hypothetical protein
MDVPYDFQQLYEGTEVVTRNSNKVIDGNYSPIQEVRLSKHGPPIPWNRRAGKLHYKSGDAKRLNVKRFNEDIVLQVSGLVMVNASFILLYRVELKTRH